MMTRKLLAFSALALATRLALAADPAEVSVYLFDEGQPVAGAEVRIDDAAQGRTNSDGALRMELEPGTRLLRVFRDGAEVLQFQLNLVPEENAELIATLYSDAAPSIFIESSHAGAGTAAAPADLDAGPPGTLSGRIVSSENGQPVVAARIYVSGTPLDIVTDAEGRFSAPLSPGEYSLSVVAATFASRSFDGVAVSSGAMTERDIELTPAGVELPEFVVLEPYIEGSLASFVEERRSSSAVTDILGAEQISRAGDSDAAGALRRVTGLTLVDGKFVYVRGLGERYSSALLNGAQIPSPDPTRRVVPLDLFPTDLLSGIVIQKTYSPDMPGEFAGGTIQLRTRGVPDSFLLRAQGSVGYVDGVSGQEGLRYRGGNHDWLGIDDGAREAPEGLIGESLPPRSSDAREQIGESLAAQGYAIETDDLGPDSGVAFAIGDDFRFSDSGFSIGYIGALRHSHSWDNGEIQRREFSLSNDVLFEQANWTRRSSERNVDNSLFFSVGAEFGEHHALTATALQVRQTTDEARIDDGLLGSGNNEQQYLLEWLENQLRTYQLGGEHAFPQLGKLKFDWLYSVSEAGREAPNTREYRYQATGDTFRLQEVNQRYSILGDEVDEFLVNLRYPLEFGNGRSLMLSTGGSQLERSRDSEIYRFRFDGLSVREGPIEDLLSPGNIGTSTGQGFVASAGRPTDFYTASQALDGYYANADLSWNAWRLNLGARRESSDIEVITASPTSSAAPQVASLTADDTLPAASLTWAYSDAAQLRFGYSESVNRPDFRELSRSLYTDPVLDVSVGGNPDVVSAEIESLDLRWEYYFSPTESFSVALFRKDILRPIELVQQPGSGVLFTIQNAELAENSGIELDLYKSLSFATRWQGMPGFLKRLPWDDIFFSANYARIESEIDLGESGGIQTNTVRPLQGQSPYVANVALSLIPEDGPIEATLLYNVAGERIVIAGVQGKPDIYEEPFGRLDFNLSAELPWEGWKAKMRLRNLLDPDLEFTQGGGIWSTDRKGRELQLSLEWRY